LTQIFGINLKKYIGSTNKEHKWFENTETYNKSGKNDKDYSSNEDTLQRFEPSWREFLPQKYGRVNENVIYQKGDLLEQWTIIIDDPQTNEKALMKIRTTDLNPEVIQFDIEMSPVPNNNEKPNDITMNWKLMSGFESNKTFFTDGNGLEMT
jgi:hypothetical protein